MITGADIVYKSLLRKRVKNVWGYTGGAIMPILDKFYG